MFNTAVVCDDFFVGADSGSVSMDVAQPKRGARLNWKFVKGPGLRRYVRTPVKDGPILYRRALGIDDSSALPGKALTPSFDEWQQMRDRIAGLISRFQSEGFDAGDGDFDTVSADAANAAREFLFSLPDATPLPKISPDGEGGLTMLWRREGSATLVTIDDRSLYCVLNAGRDNARYLGPLPLDEDTPRDLLESLLAV